MTLRTPAQDRGTISQELPPGGEMPDTLLVSVDAASGLRSKVISLPIPTRDLDPLDRPAYQRSVPGQPGGAFGGTL